MWLSCTSCRTDELTKLPLYQCWYNIRDSLHVLLFNPACILKMILWIRMHLMWLPSCIQQRLSRFFPTDCSNIGIGYRLFCASASWPSHRVGFVVFFFLIIYNFFNTKRKIGFLALLKIISQQSWSHWTSAVGGHEGENEGQRKEL